MKRIALFAGHYGSGKTNIAVNYAFRLRDEGKRVIVADLDIVNPYFRTKDSKEDFERAGIEFISSAYANSNVDLPALPAEIYRSVEDKSCYSCIDIGGDDRGALALGRLIPYLKEEDNYEKFFVVNFFRPLTRDAKAALEVMKEIEAADHLQFTAIINNSNLGEETEAQDIADSVKKVRELEKLSGLPCVMTTVEERLADKVKELVPEENIFGLRLQFKYFAEVNKNG
ncbi:MAG: hypothetical protein Q4B67_02585 [Eubacteriales bacterium]|nr:hypothetical protein [Eubacteriales bacterium]